MLTLSSATFTAEGLGGRFDMSEEDNQPQHIRTALATDAAHHHPAAGAQRAEPDAHVRHI